MGIKEKSGFNYFAETYNAFQKFEFEDPLQETLRLFDLLSEGTLRETDLCLLRQEKIDLLDLVQKRKEGIPMEYIIGLASFMEHTFFCSPETFIPKEQTGILVKVALEFLKKKQEGENNLTIIDMATGCGNIAISLLMNLDNIKVFACDISPAVVDIAKKNVDKFCLQDRVSLFCGDFFSPLKGLGYEERIDMVVCNPPYIPTTSICKLSVEIVDYEPKVALDGGPFGIDFHRRLITDSLKLLKPKGILVFEIGIGQEELVARLFKNKEDYEDVRYHGEGAEIRVVSALKK